MLGGGDGFKDGTSDVYLTSYTHTFNCVSICVSGIQQNSDV